MRSRHSHRKSRFGCKRCKTRRIKCDEVHPACGNCVHHGDSCDFTHTLSIKTAKDLEPVMIPSLPRLDRGGNSLKTASAISSPSSTPTSRSALIRVSNPGSIVSSSLNLPYILREWPPEIIQPPEIFKLPSPTTIGTPTDRLLELKLFHHYMKITPTNAANLSEIPKTGLEEDVWKNWIANLAVNDQTLMDALLGFSASELRARNPSDHTISQASYKYMLRAITSHAKQVRRGVDSQNAEVLFATSTFMALYSGMNSPGTVSGLPLHWFRSYQGTRAIAEAGWDKFQNSKIQQHLKMRLDFIESFNLQQTLPKGSDLPFGFLLSDLNPDDHDAETTTAYRVAVGCLSSMHEATISKSVLSFPGLVPRRFVALLEAEDPRTLTIVGYFFMLLKIFGPHWWVRGQAEADFRAVMELIPGDWRPRMDWAVREFEQDVSPHSQSKYVELRFEGCLISK